MEGTGRDLEKTSSITIKINGYKKCKKRLRKLNKEVKNLNRTLEKSVELKKKLLKTASCKKQPIPMQKNIKTEKVEVVAITSEDNRRLLLVGNETIEISDYRTESTANGATKLHVTIAGETVSTELLANSKK